MSTKYHEAEVECDHCGRVETKANGYAPRGWHHVESRQRDDTYRDPEMTRTFQRDYCSFVCLAWFAHDGIPAAPSGEGTDTP